MMSRPLAYFLTWTTYGTWLPGDKRGWLTKGGGIQLPNSKLEQRAARLMTEPACTLSPEQRLAVGQTIERHCQMRGWYMRAANCRSNHVHVVVSAQSTAPSTVINQCKPGAHAS